MSKRMEGAPQMPSQGNERVSREEYEQINATLAKMIELLEENKREIAELRAEKESRLGAAASLAANPEDDDSYDSEDAHADEADSEATRVQVGEELDDEPGVGVTTNTIDSLQLDDEGKKKEKKGHPVARGFAMGVLATAVIATGVGAGLSKLANNDSPKSPDIKLSGDVAGDYLKETIKDVQANAEESAVAKAEEARQQQVAETMGMSVEDMHAVADRHGVEYNKIGTAEAHNQMRDGMESSYNLSEKVDLEGMSEAERSERSKQEIEFANMNNKYVTAQISSARLGASDGSDAELTRRLFSQYEENDAVWQEHAKENAKLLKESTYSTRLAGTAKTYTYGTENAWDGLIERQYVVENSGGETVYIVEVANGNMKIQFKDGCVQAVWTSVAQSHQRQERTKTVTSTQRQEERREEDHGGGEIERKEFHWKDKGGGEEHRRETDEKDKTKDDSQEKDEDENKETTGSHDDAGIKRGNQVDRDRDGLPDSDSDSKSGNGEKDIKGSQGKDDSERPGEKNQDHSNDKETTADDRGDNSKKKVADGQDKANDIENKKGTTDTSDKDSNSRSEHRSWTWSEEGGRRPDGSEYHHRDSSDTGWVSDSSSSTSDSGQTGGNIELDGIMTGV